MFLFGMIILGMMIILLIGEKHLIKVTLLFLWGIGLSLAILYGG